VAIVSFRDEETARVWRQEISRRLPRDMQRAAYRRLAAIDQARDVLDLRAPAGNNLEQLAGARAGQHSVRINRQWRICFVWRDDGAHDVEIVDYH
jgi:proteic killer suppression protein